MKRSLVALAALLALAVSAFAQVGGAPGITNPPFSGGTITTGVAAPTGCTPPAYGFSANASAGMCAVSANSFRFTTGNVAGTDRSFVGLSNSVANTPSTTMQAFDQSNNFGVFTVGVTGGAGYFNFNTGSAVRFLFSGSTSELDLGGSAAHDQIKILPVVAGAGAFAGTLTTQDLTAARTWTAPNSSGTVPLLAGDVSVTTDTATTWTQTGTTNFGGGVKAWYFQHSPGGFVFANHWNNETTAAELYTTLVAGFDGHMAESQWEFASWGDLGESRTRMSNLGFSTQRLRDARKSPGFGTLASLISGGYNLAINYATTPPDTFSISLNDGDSSITGGFVQVCGSDTEEHDNVGVMSVPYVCETITLLDNVTTYTTAQTYWAVYVVKSSSLAGAGGGDQIRGNFTTELAGSAFLYTAIVDHPASDYTGASSLTASGAANYGYVKCVDLAGCNLEPYSSYAGQRFLIAVIAGSTSLVFTESGNMKLAGGPYTLDQYDTIEFVNLDGTVWSEISHSIN